MSTLASIVQGLNYHSNRDKTLRILSYGALLVADSRFVGPKQRDVLNILAARFSETRTVLRLMDDLPMLQFTINYGLGKSQVRVAPLVYKISRHQIREDHEFTLTLDTMFLTLNTV